MSLNRFGSTVDDHLDLKKTCNLSGSCTFYDIITFHVSRRRREMQWSRASVCVCLSVWMSAAACPHCSTDPDVAWSGRGCPLVVHGWADLQSVNWLRFYGNISRTRNVSEYMLLLALCLVILVPIALYVFGNSSYAKQNNENQSKSK